MKYNDPYILIAEDDEDDRMLLEAAFTELFPEILLVFVENGIELINHLEKTEREESTNFPSLLILDLNMPKKNGKEVLFEIKEKRYFPLFKTIIFSTTSADSERNSCIELGIHDYFVKPTAYKQLLEIVEKFCLIAGFTD